MSDGQHPTDSGLPMLRPTQGVPHEQNVFPNEEELRSRARGGEKVLPPPHFSQQASTSGDGFIDSGRNLTPEFTGFEHRSGDLKSGGDLGLGQY